MDRQSADVRYRQLLDEAGRRDTAALLSGELARRQLYYGGAPICATVQPGFVAAGENAAFRSACHQAMALIERADAAFRGDRGWPGSTSHG